MRILVISNFYPPHFIGGYELGCRDVVEALKSRGHDVRVLTSTFGVNRPEHSGHVYRWLATDLSLKIDGSASDLLRVIKKESINRRAFDVVCREFPPDAVYVWNATHISISLAIKAQQKGLAVHYFISDHWLSKWESDALYSLRHRSPRRASRRLAWRPVRFLIDASGLLPPPAPDLSRVQFASRYLKQAALQSGRPVANAEVIHWGIDADRFPFNESSHDPRRLLYVGQITALKGVHTAVEALRLLVETPRHRSTKLTIVGGPDYDDRVRGLVSSLGLERNVSFTGLVSRDRLPDIYREHDVLLFPSVWDEPFSITLLEAMSSGLAVVGTSTGGTPEILEDEVNALIFPKEDAEALAGQIVRLVEDPELFERVRRNGRRTVEEGFRFEDMVDRIDLALKRQAG
ncbi:MAG TPA: glycosyltransferase family 4 protein [Blastocatellia bacterium]|nr:glycosyltransferase family 4 protein [Blastocatellia bacterium]